ncbi:TPA: hypothetical protein RKV92_002982 [Enterobacter hormaechei subsp. steigerwaltii]|nr:hypothetical protein [Enterobacter hormaechei subsp. steigerwaltii]
MKKYLNPIAYIAFFVMVWAISYLSPMQSDDYAFYNLGFSIDKHIAMYMGWSGRYIVDYISPIILFAKSNVLSATVTATVSTLLMHVIRRIAHGGTAIFCLIAVSFFIFNPSIGQNTFWVVGFVNYLIPSLLLMLLCNNLMKGVKFTLPQAALGFLAGASNESVAVLSVGFIVCHSILAFINKRFAVKDLALLPFVLVGSASMLLAPGNAARASGPSFSSWYSKDLTERIYFHMLDRMPEMLVQYGALIIVIMTSMFILSSLSILHDKTKMQYSFIFFALAIGSNVIMFAAPYYPQRAMTTGFILLLSSLSLIISSFDGKISKFYTPVLFLTLLPVFLVDYFMLSSYYIDINNQYLDRVAMIEKGIHSGEKVITVPKYNEKNTFRLGDRLDKFHNPKAAGEYYGIDYIYQK